MRFRYPIGAEHLRHWDREIVYEFADPPLFYFEGDFAYIGGPVVIDGRPTDGCRLPIHYGLEPVDEEARAWWVEQVIP